MHPSADQLQALASGKLQGEEAADVERHVDGCALCAQYLAALPRKTVAFVQQGEGPGLAAVPGYEILEELGRGGMGVVYRARQVGLNRVVALKMILSGEYAGAEELARFQAEAEAIARLHHPNIVQIHEVGEHNGRPFFSLEYCPSGNLARKLAGTPLPPREAAALIEQLARAVEAAHQRQVIHRDLKPGNVLLGQDGAPKITDFGLAKMLGAGGEAGKRAPWSLPAGEAGEPLTASGAVLGTPSYMAPEQAGGKTKEIGPLADVYSLGAIFYECLTGRPPFKGPTPVDTILQVLSQEPVPPSRLQPGLPRDLETMCLKCLQKEPSRRYQTAGGLAEDLRRFLAGEPIRARPVRVLERTWKWVKRRPAAAALLAVLVLSSAAALALATWALGERSDALQARDEAENQRKVAQRHAAQALFEQALFQCEHEDLKRGLLSLASSLKESSRADAQDLAGSIRWHLSAWARSLRTLKPVWAHETYLRPLAFDPAGEILVQIDGLRTLQPWQAVALSPDRKTVLTGGGGDPAP
jgi:hypothetical protein